MNRHSAAVRFVMLATLATLLAGFAGPAVVQARDGRSTERHVRYASDPQRETAGVRSFRHVDVGSLPAATGKRSPSQPTLRRPGGGSTPAPDTQGGSAPAPVPVTANGDPIISQATAFNGLAQSSGPATGGEPPDPWVAAGPDHIVQAVNTTFRISKRSGAVLETVDMFDFFGLGEFYEPHANQVAYYDPRVIYDSLHSRWIAIQTSFDCFTDDQAQVGYGYIDLAISSGPDPTAVWDILSIPFADVVPDYAGIGTSTDKVVVSANEFEIVSTGTGMGCDANETSSYLGGELDVMLWSELMAGGSVAIDFTPTSAQYFSWRPALQTPATSPTVYLITEQADLGVAYTTINGSPATPSGPYLTPFLDLSDMGVLAPFALPPPPQQPDPPLDNTIQAAVDQRPTDAIWKNNKLNFVSTYPCDLAGGAAGARDCVRVSELNTVVPTAPTRIQDFLISEDDTDLFMGGIGYALNDDLHVVWTRSSAAAGAYPSNYGAYQDAGSANNTISDRTALSAGLASYNGMRWGSYVGVAQDPQVPNAVWQGNQYAAVGPGPNNWATEVTQLQTGGSTYVPITPIRVLDSRPGISIGLSGPFSHGVARTWAVGGVGTIPANAVAVTGNLTVANQTAGGYVSVTPGLNNNPSSSTINFPLGDNRANNLTIPLAPGGKVAAVFRATAGKTAHLIFDVTGYFVAGAGQAEYKTISPVRALDSRPGINIGLSGAFQKNVPRELSIGPAHVPANAVAITGNLTVVGQTGGGFLAITPTSNANPTTSNLNFPVGDARANGFVAPLDAEDDIWIVYKTTLTGPRSTHVIVDVTGYFVDDPAGMQYFPLTPGRIMDTRSVPLSGLNGVFTSNTPRKLVVGGHWGVPASAGAITGNLTATGQTAGGFVVVTLTNNPNPTTSNLNFPLGDTRANGITVPLSGTDVWLVYKTTTTGKRTHLILDVSGYFD
jgi:hypothetical protein